MFVTGSGEGDNCLGKVFTYFVIPTAEYFWLVGSAAITLNHNPSSLFFVIDVLVPSCQ